MFWLIENKQRQHETTTIEWHKNNNKKELWTSKHKYFVVNTWVAVPSNAECVEYLHFSMLVRSGTGSSWIERFSCSCNLYMCFNSSWDLILFWLDKNLNCCLCVIFFLSISWITLTLEDYWGYLLNNNKNSDDADNSNSKHKSTTLIIQKKERKKMRKK